MTDRRGRPLTSLSISIAMFRMAEPLVKVHLHEHAGTIILNRPDKRNALNRSMIEQLEQAFRDLHGQRKVRSVLLMGAGETFCSGLDLAEMQETSRADNAQALWYEDAVALRDLLELMLRFPKPIIAAVQGAALGSGAGLALACDMIIAAKTAAFGLPEPRRGLVAGLVAPLLTFRVGSGRAAYLMLTAQTINADEAFRVGLFQEVVPADHLWPRAVELSAMVADSAPEAILLTKRLLNETIGEYLDTLFSAGAAVTATSRTTEAAAEGIAAFVEKRPPKWP